MKVKVVLAAADEALAFIPLEGLAVVGAGALEAPHVQENCEGCPGATADVLDVPLAYDTDTAARIRGWNSQFMLLRLQHVFFGPRCIRHSLPSWGHESGMSLHMH